MSTASPLPLQPLPPSTLSDAESLALKQQVARRLADHRQRRGRSSEAQPSLPMEPARTAPRNRNVADSVAARFAKSVSYRDFLQQEAESALRQAEAAAEVAHRNALAIAAVQQELLEEIDQWNAASPQPVPQAEGELLSFAQSRKPEPGEEKAVAAAPSALAPQQAAPAAAEPVAVAAAPSPIAFVLPQEPLEPAIPIPANLIEFPRQLVAARRARPRLAEGPLRDEADASPERAQLRIFEVEAATISTEPELATSLPEWHTIRLDAPDSAPGTLPVENSSALTQPVFVAPVSLRLMAFAVDACCIATAFLVGVTGAAYAVPELPTGVPGVLAMAGSLLFFGLLYQVLFFWLAGATPGMRYARIGMCTFSDDNPSRGAMLRRIFSLLLATLPLGLGVVWAAMDEDGLGWHDRMSRMYPRAY